jgi:tRNA A22 N-methylase
VSNQIADPRLRLAASMVREGARFADVGTDHAYLPLYLLSIGRIASAVAADVAEGPLARARDNVRAAGREGDVTLMLTDGLQVMDKLGLTDIAICGMGGELIASILEAAPFVRDPAIRLILQPMTRVDALRTYLAAHGFAVFAERYTVASGRVYTCLGVAFGAAPRTLTAIEAALGDPAVRSSDDKDALRILLDMRAREAEARIRGRRDGGLTAEADEALLLAINREREALL